MINAPELHECYGHEALRTRSLLVAEGFHADVYTEDRYGRLVSVVTTASGENVNVWLARHGYADDRYLDDSRHENPSLAWQLDLAFAAAERDGAGLWSACR